MHPFSIMTYVTSQEESESRCCLYLKMAVERMGILLLFYNILIAELNIDAVPDMVPIKIRSVYSR